MQSTSTGKVRKDMHFFKQWGRFMMTGARAHARWEIQMAGNLLASRKRVLVLLLLTIPIVMGGSYSLISWAARYLTY
jgi:hypothetical protein